MKTLVVYDSWFGNTRQIAEAIAAAVGKGARAIDVKDDPEQYIDESNLLIVGSPTHGGTYTPAIQDFLYSFSAGDLQDFVVATFDTRLEARWVQVFGSASKRIARKLQAAGGKLVMPPEEFLVHGREGPLLGGELVRSQDWAKQVARRASMGVLA